MASAKESTPETFQESNENQLSDQPTPKDSTSSPEDWESKYKELHDQYMRLAADFDNYRKRTHNDFDQLRKYGAENTLLELLPFMDNLERAGKSLSESSEPKVLYQSFRLVSNQLMETLKNLGVQKMETVGQSFDPNLHEAVAQIEKEDVPESTVVFEQQSGYLLRDRVLRPAQVAVSVHPEASEKTVESANPFGDSQPVGNPFVPQEPAK